MNSKYLLASIILFSLSLISCDNEKQTTLQDGIKIQETVVNPVANFVPGVATPSAHDLAFLGTDQLVGIPDSPSDSASAKALKAALRGLDGFSTIGPVTTTFSHKINPATINGSTVLVYELNATGISKLNFGVAEVADDYIAFPSPVDPTGKTLVIQPKKPLKFDTRYLVVLTKDIKTSDAKGFIADVIYALTKSNTPLVNSEGKSTVGVLSNEQAPGLERLRLGTVGTLAAIAAKPDDVILSWTFLTQGGNDVLKALRSGVIKAADDAAVAESVSPKATVENGILSDSGTFTIYKATIEIPYYLGKPSAPDPTLFRNIFWKDSEGKSLVTTLNATTGVISVNQPKANEAALAIPVILTVPATGSAPWPVVIYQHGITRNRRDVLIAAKDYAANGLAMVAIDLPLHGITNKTDSYYKEVNERHFNLNLVKEDDKGNVVSGTDLVIDSSGRYFINTDNLLVSRDNIRQGVADLVVLTQGIVSGSFSDIANGGNAALNFDASKIYLLSHSLGGIIGGTFLAVEPRVKAAVLANSGGGIAKLLNGSAVYGKILEAALGAGPAPILPNTAAYEQFLVAAQWILDPADPINYTGSIGTGRGLMIVEVKDDQTVPNSVPNTLSGTEPMAKLLGMTDLTTASITTGTNNKAWLKFKSEQTVNDVKTRVITHEAILGEELLDGINVSDVMRKKTAEFLKSNSGSLTLDPSTQKLCLAVAC